MGFEGRIRLRWRSGSVNIARPSGGGVLLEPRGQFRRSVATACHQAGHGGFGAGEAVCRPNRFQVLTDARAGLGVGRVMDGILGEVELAALPLAPPKAARRATRRPA